MSIPSNRPVNKREILKRDERVQRDIILKLQERNRPIAESMWAEHQKTLYPDIMHVSNAPTLQNLLANSQESLNQEDSLQISYLARTNLLSITDNDEEITNYILDRLDDNERVAMNENFHEIVEVVKTNYIKMSKKTFIRLIREKTFNSGEETPVELEKMYPDAPSTPPVSENPMKKTPIFTSPPPMTPKKVYTALLKNIEISDSEEIKKYNAILNTLKPLKKIQLQIKLEKYVPGLVPPSFTVKQLQTMLANIMYNDIPKLSGKGMSRVISGRGVARPHNSRVGLLYGGKYSINLEKLQKCILHVYYTKSRASLVKSEMVSIDTRDVILDILHQRFNITRFNKLQPDEQRIVSNFVKTTKIPDIDLSEFNEAYQRRFEVLRGEIQSGNNSPVLLKEFKHFLNRAITEGLIPKNQAMDMLLTM
jgi:sulfur relay (sulfurtransferase) DsrC/TusE family protein